MPGTACDYYTRKSDTKVFAVKTEDGRPIKAVGPLDPDQVGSNPVAHDWRQAQDARHWNLRRDFIALGRKWVRYGAQLRQKPKTSFAPAAAGRHAPQRVFAPGFILPGR